MNRRFTLVLEAAPSEVDADQRLKRLLKFAWRGLRLRCRSIAELKDEKEPAP